MLTAILPIAGKILDRVIPDKAAAEAAKMEMQRQYVAGDLKALEADVELAKSQIEVNQQEAKHDSLFVSGWRPAVGWVCVAGLAWNFILRPFAAWLTVLMGHSVAAMPPALDMGDLMTLLLGMLGLGGYRTYEKMRGVARKSL